MMNLSYKKLLIISHTEHFKDASSLPNGWTPTVREIDFLAGHFKEVIHLAVLHEGEPPKSTVSYSAKNVKFIGVPPFGGGGFVNKLKIITVLPRLLFLIYRQLKEVDYFQFRAPTSIGLFVIPFLTLFSSKKGWYKYAGSWVQPNMPKSYAIQKWMLETWQKRAVTINGEFKNQKAHIYSFENPCLNIDEIIKNKSLAEKKIFKKPFTGCFVGRLDDSKGVDKIVEYLNSAKDDLIFDTFHFIGNDENVDYYRNKLEVDNVDIQFHGFLDRSKTFSKYLESHILFLPSKSEGFPKVVAEASSFGTIPVVSNVGSINQFINDYNGFVWDMNLSFTEFVSQIDFENINDLKNKSDNLFDLAVKFTFENYMEKLKKFVLN